MQLRRAVLLFAIVLGLAAVAASFSREREDGGRASEEQRSTAAPKRTPTASATPEGASPRTVRFDGSRRSRSATLLRGSAGVVEVRVPSPGLVDIDGLGLSASAEPLTPARFDVLAAETGRHVVSFTPAGGREARRVGVLIVKPAGNS